MVQMSTWTFWKGPNIPKFKGTFIMDQMSNRCFRQDQMSCKGKKTKISHTTNS